MTQPIGSVVESFLAYKRALSRKYQSEERELRLLVRFAEERGVVWLDQLTPALVDDFLASRPRSRPRSFNHLLGVVSCLLEWAVSQQLLQASPLLPRRRRVSADRIPFIFDIAQARRLLHAAAALQDNPRAPQRGATYHALFALCYGLGLRAGEACRLCLGDIDLDRRLLVVVGGKFGKSRLVPFGPRVGELLQEQVKRRQATDPCWGAKTPLFSFDGRNCINPCTASITFHHLVSTLGLPITFSPIVMSGAYYANQSRDLDLSVGGDARAQAFFEDLAHTSRGTDAFYYADMRGMLEGKPRGRICMQGYHSCVLEADGGLHACVNSETLTFGNLREQPFREIWWGEKAEALRRQLHQEICPTCPSKCYARPVSAGEVLRISMQKLSGGSGAPSSSGSSEV